MSYPKYKCDCPTCKLRVFDKFMAIIANAYTTEEIKRLAEWSRYVKQFERNPNKALAERLSNG